MSGTWGGRVRSLGGNAELDVCLLLFGSKGAEEIDLLLAGGLPRVVRFEGALEMGLDIDVESLGL